MFITNDGLRAYMMVNHWPIWTSMAGSLVTMMAMVCNPQITRSFPMNYGLLGVFTLFQAVMVGFICMVRTLLLLGLIHSVCDHGLLLQNSVSLALAILRDFFRSSDVPQQLEHALVLHNHKKQ